MCQTMLLSDSIVSLSKRTFARRLRMASSRMTVEKGMLTKLNNQLDGLYEKLYDNYPSMTEADYYVFRDYLYILIETLKGLYKAYQRLEYGSLLKEYTDRLLENISAIEEMDADIRNFKINLPKNSRYSSIMNQAKTM